MLKHIRANLWLLVLTVLLCSVLYPLALLGVAQLPFLRDQAEGSLIYDDSGKAVGSRLIAQQFKGKEYFQSRPSAVAYDAAASGASNYAANNPLLRDRVARALGPIVKYKKGRAPGGRTVQEDVADWFASRPNIVAEWAEKYPSSAQAWVKADDKHKAAVTAWQEKHAEAVAAWKKDNPGKEPAAADLAGAFFTDNAAAFHQAWPKLIDDPAWSKEAVFFDLWLQAHPEVDREGLLEPVPADMVTTSGSGLDPHITLANALYQLDRVAGAWAAKTGADREAVRREVEGLLRERAAAPLGGLAGVPLVNVLEVNLELPARARRAGGGAP